MDATTKKNKFYKPRRRHEHHMGQPYEQFQKRWICVEMEEFSFNWNSNMYASFRHANEEKTT